MTFALHLQQAASNFVSNTGGGTDTSSLLFSAYWDPTVETRAQVESEIGPVQFARVFYPTTVPATYDPNVQVNAPGLPAIVSFKDYSANLDTYIASIPAGTQVMMCPYHEPENDMSGAAFIDFWTTARSKIKAANPNIPVGYIAMAYQYETSTGNQDALNGLYTPDNSLCDWYGTDYYQTPVASLPTADSGWNNWYNLIKNRGKPLVIAEWGLAAQKEGSDPDPTEEALRAQLIPQYISYWLSVGVTMVNYWYIQPKTTETWVTVPTDAASLQALKDIPRG